MRLVKIFVVVALAAAALPAAASAQSGFGGVYSGTTDENQSVSVLIASNGAFKSITGAAVRKLNCTREDRSKPFPDDRQTLPPKEGAFAIDKTIRGNIRGSFFSFGTDGPTSGDRVSSFGQGRFKRVDGKTIIDLSLGYDEIDEFETGEQRCSGSSTATLTKGSSAPAGTAVKLRRPARLFGSLKAIVPKLASLGDDGIGISITKASKANGGEIEVSIKRDTSKPDTLQFGSGELGSNSMEVKRGRAGMTVDMKRPRRTPSSGDSVPMIVTVTFSPRRGKARTAKTRIVVKG